MDMPDRYTTVIEALRSEERLRAIPSSMPHGMTDFTSNDYLGIAAAGELEREFVSSLGTHPGFTSSASRLLACRQDEYAALEEMIGEAYSREALLFNSGYHANVGCISALASGEALMVCDKLVHASIIDGLRLSRTEYKRFRHNDMTSLRRLLDRCSPHHQCIWVVVESIYSMDGDISPLRELVEIKKEYPCVRLYVDEAHALGANGPTGLGLCEEMDVMNAVDLIIGTCGKAMASCGAFAAADGILRQFLLNSARSFIFSTMIPPVNVAYSTFIFSRMRGMKREREHLAAISVRLRESLRGMGLDTGPSCSHIVPLMAGSNRRAVEYASQLQERGFMVMPIRRPTVAEGTERLRFSLSAAMGNDDIDRLVSAVREVVKHHNNED